jgi:signal transduction histidine kinase
MTSRAYGWLRGSGPRGFGLRPRRLDLLLAVAFALVAVLEVKFSHRDGPAGLSSDVTILRDGRRVVVPPPPTMGPAIVIREDGFSVAASLWLNLVIAGAFAWRSRWPLAVFGVQMGAIFTIHGHLTWPGFLAIVVAAFSLVLRERRPVVSIGALAVAAVLVAITINDSTPDLPGWSAPFVIFGPIALFGLAIRAAHGRADAQAERASLLERQQQAVADAAVAAERSRIARELHDVVSHHVSVITVQAGAAGKVLDTEPELARAAVAAIETSGREAMGELRHLLGVLAPPAGGEAASVPLLPQPGLDQLASLIDNVRAAGQPVTVRGTAPPPPLPRGVDLTAYRVVQEALTNALRYAPGARVDVLVGTTGGSLLIEVANEEPLPRAEPPPVGAGSAGAASVAAGSAGSVGSVGAGSPGARSVGAASMGAGSGLLGLAERLRLYHGTLEAGRRLGGGFRVRAVIPIEQAG